VSKKRNRQASSIEVLAQWSEGMARHTLELAREADTNRRRRALTFRAKQHARVATLIRVLLRAAAEERPTP
jgi:hypothetical protein